jgi:hypothetical protein
MVEHVVVEQFIVVFGIWALWSLASLFWEASPWVWIVVPLALGVAGQVLIDYHDWWLGFGLGGGALFLMRLADLLLVTADWIRVLVLRAGRTRQ